MAKVNLRTVKTIAGVLGTAVPVVVAYLKEHPELGERLTGAATKVFDRAASGPAGLVQTLDALSEQTDYLTRSADDEAERARALAWTRRIVNYRHAATMLTTTPDRKALKDLKAKVARLRTEVFEAFVAEQAQDGGAPPLLPGD